VTHVNDILFNKLDSYWNVERKREREREKKRYKKDRMIIHDIFVNGQEVNMTF